MDRNGGTGRLGDEKDWESNEPVGINTLGPMQNDPDLTDTEPSISEIEDEKKQMRHNVAVGGSSSSADGYDEKSSAKPDLERAITSATTATEYSRAEEPEKKRSFMTKINPLKRNPPPVPDKRGDSLEHKANWFSKLTFHWITPVMSVSSSR